MKERQAAVKEKQEEVQMQRRQINQLTLQIDRMKTENANVALIIKNEKKLQKKLFAQKIEDRIKEAEAKNAKLLSETNELQAAKDDQDAWF